MVLGERLDLGTEDCLSRKLNSCIGKTEYKPFKVPNKCCRARAEDKGDEAHSAAKAWQRLPSCSAREMMLTTQQRSTWRLRSAQQLCSEDYRW